MSHSISNKIGPERRKRFRVGMQPQTSAFDVGSACPLFLIAGPCVIESEEHTFFLAEKIKLLTTQLGIPFVFKASYDKANRTSASSYRGPGLVKGANILSQVREKLNIPVITDVHSVDDVNTIAEIVDIIQIPAFLCRQTDLLLAAGASGKPVMIKKGQFLSPADMKYAAEKVVGAGSGDVLFCERGSCFGYRELVVDFRSLITMGSLGSPVVFDGTHSVQVMGGAGGSSSGNRSFVSSLCRAAVAIGVDGIFLECHEDPDRAPSDGPNMIPLELLEDILKDLKALSELELHTREGR